MALNQITRSLLSNLAAIGGLPQIYYPNTHTDLPTTNYIRPTVRPANTSPLALATSDKEIGLLQVSIFIKKGSGEITASDIAETILAGFPRNLKLDGVRIDRPGSIGSSFYDGAWQVTPVLIPYQNIK